LAREFSLFISFGGFHERPDDASAQRIRNTHVYVNPQGKVLGTYSKTHLFDVDVKDGKYTESQTVEPGKEFVVVRSAPTVNVGLSICYDLRFPAMYAALRAHGAHMLLVPSAFMCRYKEDATHELLQVEWQLRGLCVYGLGCVFTCFVIQNLMCFDGTVAALANIIGSPCCVHVPSRLNAL
jgi:predicted amidohydrolase